MDLGEHINAYCERHSADWNAEPLNALSNAAFFYAAWRLWRRAANGTTAAARAQRVLAVLIGLVGAGSLSFHTLATRWASILDVVFIGIFNVVFLVCFLRIVAAWPLARAIAAGAAFVALDRATGALLPAGMFNGSVLYVPALAVLLALTAYARTLSPSLGGSMTMASGVFCVSLLARSLDQTLCAVWPPGLHFVWHLLNAWLLWTLAGTLAVHAPAPATRPGGGPRAADTA